MLELPVGTAKTRIRDGLIRLRDTMGVGVMTGDIHALSGAYAVDALDDIERAQFERHLAECAGLPQRGRPLREAAALLAETTATTPSAQLRDRVLADIAEVRPLPPAGATVTDLEPTSASTGSLPLLSRPLRRSSRSATGADRLAAGGRRRPHRPPTSRVIAGQGRARSSRRFCPAGATATVVRSETQDEAVLVTEEMPAAPEGQGLRALAPARRRYGAGRA